MVWDGLSVFCGELATSNDDLTGRLAEAVAAAAALFNLFCGGGSVDGWDLSADGGRAEGPVEAVTSEGGEGGARCGIGAERRGEGARGVEHEREVWGGGWERMS